MTEEEWLTTADILDMQGMPAVVSNSRKLRLFSVACCRELDQWLTNPRVRKALDAVERYADRGIKHETMGKWYREVLRACDATRTNYSPEWIAYHAVANAATSDHYSSWYLVCGEILRSSSVFEDRFISGLRVRFASLLRDIFGNPFRPVAFDPGWRTSTVVALARQMYDSRDFSPMPILADALQDAGCDHPDILAHCRGDAPHVRGCWVVDGVLGKS